MASSTPIRPDIVGWVGLALTLLAVALVQWFGSWGYILAVPALVLLLAGIFGMQREMGK